MTAKIYKIIRIPINKIDRGEGSFRWYIGNARGQHKVKQMVKTLIYDTKKKLPPIRVVPSSRKKGRWRVVNGHHRLTAHQVARRKEIDAIVRDDMRENPYLRKHYRNLETAYLGMPKKRLRMIIKNTKPKGFKVKSSK